ncbi:hypothetical protein CEUSTIGMA_g11900.t1 [Chlamydomonas eustigma]|uniref:Uncharacterized protein n=1 Tax=Chlamydomonas eustigma TaxID=1157962 RepID=A0A250XNW2_9CHLO|nr:hypothetical protein CEUSTIGMA_g11900.t1 [Chlamydomonas eustigma]|eukprot:GAX84480.1 hypothetical protein CEUSTIGMA_g11900.t1 [Chlamydomonas eustigma]
MLRTRYGLEGVTYDAPLTETQLRSLARYVTDPSGIATYAGMSSIADLLCRWPRPVEIGSLYRRLTKKDLQVYRLDLQLSFEDDAARTEFVGPAGENLIELTRQHDLMYAWLKAHSMKEASEAARALLEWLDGPDCSYDGIRDRLILGHRVLGIVNDLSDDRPHRKQQQEEEEHRKHRKQQQEEEEHRKQQQVVEEQRKQQQLLQQYFERLERADEGSRAAERRVREAVDAAVSEVSAALVQAERRGQQKTHDETELLRKRCEQVSREALDADRRALDAERRSAATLSQVLHSSEIQRLRAEVERLQTASTANHAKGVAGEAAVARALADAFDAWTVRDTSSVGQESDLQLISPCGTRLLAVEVKNKATIVSTDVSKAMRDLEMLEERHGPKLVGYLFVSVRSRNIPNKGALKLELVRGVPVLWIGLDPPDAERLLQERDTRDLGRAAS